RWTSRGRPPDDATRGMQLAPRSLRLAASGRRRQDKSPSERATMFGENTAVSTTADGGARRGASVLRNRYVLETRLAQGRLGTMHRATDRLRAQGLEHVAILVLPAEISADPARLDAFKAGFEDVRALSHPNIVELYDLDCDGDEHFVVLEWIGGAALRS